MADGFRSFDDAEDEEAQSAERQQPLPRGARERDRGWMQRGAYGGSPLNHRGWEVGLPLALLGVVVAVVAVGHWLLFGVGVVLAVLGALVLFRWR